MREPKSATSSARYATVGAGPDHRPAGARARSIPAEVFRELFQERFQIGVLVLHRPSRLRLGPPDVERYFPAPTWAARRRRVAHRRRPLRAALRQGGRARSACSTSSTRPTAACRRSKPYQAARGVRHARRRRRSRTPCATRSSSARRVSSTETLEPAPRPARSQRRCCSPRSTRSGLRADRRDAQDARRLRHHGHRGWSTSRPASWWRSSPATRAPRRCSSSARRSTSGRDGLGRAPQPGAARQRHESPTRAACMVPGTPEAEPQASIIVPLQVRGKVSGVLTLDRLGRRHFDERELEIGAAVRQPRGDRHPERAHLQRDGAAGHQRRPHRHPQLPPLPRDAERRR